MQLSFEWKRALDGVVRQILQTGVLLVAPTISGNWKRAGDLVSAAAGANAGASPPAPVINNSSDGSGYISFGTGTVPAAGAQVAVTFAHVITGTPVPCVVVCWSLPAAGSTTLGGCSAVVQGTNGAWTGFIVYSTGAPAASQANTTYAFSYVVIGT